MSTSSAATAGSPAFTFGFLPPVSKKLTCSNYNMWFTQVSSTIKGAQFGKYIRPDAAPPVAYIEGDVDATSGKKGEPQPNPVYEMWVT